MHRAVNLQPATPHEAAKQLAPWLCTVLKCPDNADDLEKIIRVAENYLLVDDGEAIGWLMLNAYPRADDWVLDFTVRPDRQRKWATPGLLKQAAEIIFKNRNYVSFEVRKDSAAMKLALKIGAKPIYIAGMNAFMLTRNDFLKGRFA